MLTAHRLRGSKADLSLIKHVNLFPYARGPTIFHISSSVMITFITCAKKLKTGKENPRGLKPIITHGVRAVKQAKEASRQLIHTSSFRGLLGNSAYSHRIVTISSAEVG
jgi:hypothetical protein